VTTILLVEDSDACRTTTMAYLARAGFTVDAAPTGEDALAVFDPQVHQLVVTDNAMPGISGRELARIIKLQSPSTPILMYSGSPPADCRDLDAVLLKDSQPVLLRTLLEKLLRGPTCERKSIRIEARL
jgi:CheY-like chemotaxis protein